MIGAFTRRHAEVLWLALVVGAASAVTIAYVLKVKGYFVMPDELTYQRQMLGIARGGHPLFPGDPYYTTPSQLMPLLHAPVWGLAASMPAALELSHALNALVFASAAIPVHLLVRRVTGSVPAGLAAGAASVTVPWIAMSGSLMTEPVAYTAFAWALLALQRAVADPSPRGDALGLVAVLAAAAARSQLAFLVGVLVAAVVIREVAGPRVAPGEALRRHAILVGAFLIAVAYFALSGSTLGDTIGSYEIVTEGGVLSGGAFSFSRELLTSAGLACAGITLPLAAGWALGALGAPRNRESFACALVIVLAGVGAVLVAGEFSARVITNLGAQNDRYIQYLAPVLFAGAAAALTVGPLRLVPTVLATAGTAWIFATSTLQMGPSLASPGSTFRTVIDGRSRVLAGWFGIDAEPTAVIAVLVAIAVAVVLLARWRLPRSGVAVAVAVALGVVGYGIAQTLYTLRAVARTQEGAGAGFLASRGWADRAAPDGEQVSALMGVVGDDVSTVAVWWDAVFYNRRVEQVHVVNESATYGQFDLARVALDERTGALSGLPGGYLLVPTAAVSFGLRGTREIAQIGGVSLVRTPPRPQADFVLESEAGAATQAPGAG